MAENRKGSAKFVPGPWSIAVAKYFTDRIKNDPFQTKDKVANESGIAEGRLSPLLRGDKPWYLEDVDRVCKHFEIDVEKFLQILVDEGWLSESVPSIQDANQSDYGLVADHHNGDVGTENDVGFDSP